MRAYACISILAPLVLASGLAMGAPRPGKSDAAQARTHFERGKTYFEVSEYRKAIEEFKAAHIEKADPAFLYNIAECYRHLEEPRDAIVFYRRFLSSTPAHDRSRPMVEKRIAEMQALEQKQATPEPVAPPPPPPVVLAPASPPPGTAGVLVGGPSAPPAGAKPFYKRTWFYVAAGAVVALGAVGIWALSRGPEIPETPLGNQPVFQ